MSDESSFQTKQSNEEGCVWKNELNLTMHFLYLVNSHFSCTVELSTCASIQELTRTKHGPFTLEEHALHEDRWTIDEIARSLEHCMSLFPGEQSHKKFKTELPGETAVSCEDK